MADTSNIFPAFIRAEYDGRSNAFAELVRQGQSASEELKAQMRGAFAEIRNISQRGLSGAVNQSGAFDLGIGDLQQAAAAADRRAASLREMASAATALAAKEGQLSAAQQVVYRETLENAAAAETEARQQRERLVVYEQLQAEMNQTAAASGALAASTQRLVGTQGGLATSARASRFAMIQVNQQLQDSVIQMQAGTPVATIFVQQFSQLGFAMSQMQGRAATVGNFIAGPWGTAMFLGVTAVSALTSAINSNSAATTNAISATEGLSQAQSALSGLFDLATGKILDQTGVLSANTQAQLLNAQATAIRLRTEAARQASSAREVFSRSGEESWFSYLQAAGSRAGGGGGGAFRAIGDSADEQRRLLAAIRNAPNEEARQAARLAAQRAAARPGFGQGTRVTGQEFMEAIADELNAAANNASADATDQAIRNFQNGGTLPALLRRRNSGGGRSRSGSGNDAAGRLAEFGEDAQRRIENIGARFAETPRAIEAARRALGELDDIASDLERRRPPKYESMLDAVSRTRDIIEESLDGPLREWTQEQDRQAQLQHLINTGREEEAQVLAETFRIEEQQGKLGEDQIAQIRERIQARVEEARQAEEERRRQQTYLRAIDEVRGNLESTIANLNTRGLRSIGDFANGIFGTFRQLTASSIVDSLFGPVFRQLEDYATGRGRVRQANEDLADQSDDVTASFQSLKDAADGAAEALSGAAGSGGGSGGSKSIGDAIKDMADGVKQAANDLGEATVTGQRRNRQSDLYSLDPRDFAIRTFSGLLGRLGLDENLTRRISAGVADAMQGVFIGQSAASLLFGGRANSTGSALGGALGGILGKEAGPAIGKAIGGSFGKFLGSAAGPLGSIVGGIAGSLVGNLLSSTPRASSTIGGSGGNLAITGTTGTRRLQGQTVTAADSVIANVQRIAEMFGATVDASRGSVSIGIRDGNYRVDPTGRGVTKTKRGAIDFGEDADAAVRAAVLDLIQDGVIQGLRAGTQRLLRQSKDLEGGIQKALDFEQVFKDLKARLDPVGAAIDTVDLKFDRLRKIFAEAGASAEELADLEKLYGFERADAIREATERVTGTLRALLDDLTVNNDALSLRERLGLARAQYDPLAARVAAGDTTAYDDYAEAARVVNDLTRQIYGSTDPYFDQLRQITELTAKALADQENIISIATGQGGTGGSGGTGSQGDTNAPVVSAVDRLGDTLLGGLGGQLEAVNDNLGTLIRQFSSFDLGSSGGRVNKLYGF